jgi:hypothetical protein
MLSHGVDLFQDTIYVPLYLSRTFESARVAPAKKAELRTKWNVDVDRNIPWLFTV